ncbi:MAG TPA: type VI secretion system ImpA family N-terminal domain-containing protein [Caulobacteraceae bacterium]|nr:type VI secretion system ImpA family N-terminal domain-containing protein [Caulobacteraceae bacterium]
MDIDVAKLLEPISEDAPAGPDMAYDSARYALEQAFDSSVSVDAAGQAAGEADIDWPDIIDQIVSQFDQTKDIWLAVYLCRAGAKARRLEVVEAGAQALAGLFDKYWDAVHPTLDELGVPGRKTPCDSLASRAAFLGALESTPLIRHARLGSFSGVDFERFRANGEAAEGYGFFRAALEEIGESGLAEVVQRLDGIESSLRAADRAFMDKAAGESTANFQATYETLAMLKKAVKAFLSGEPEVDPAPAAGGGAAAPATAAGPRVSGRVENREDVLKAIDAICDYYRRMEPSSPVLLVLQRAKGWVGGDFMEMLRDIMPDSLRDAKAVLMARPKDDDD